MSATSFVTPKVLADCLPGVGTEFIDLPRLAGNRALLVGVGSEAFTADQALAQASPHHRLEQVPQDIALPEAAVPVA